jgi:uncharacterized protein (DUF58 family)
MPTADRRYLLEGEQAGARYTLGLARHAPLGAAGLQLGSRAGSSLEFKEYRDYQPGDDLRHIDWNAYARSDRLTVKLYREEVHPRVDIVIDASRSMALEKTAKAAATLALAAVFAAAADNAGYSHCAWLAQDGCQLVVNGTERPSTWNDIDFTYRGNPLESFARLPPAWRPRGIRVFISDLLWLGDPLRLLAQLAEKAAAVIVVQVLAAADEHPPERGNLRLVDSETDQVREIFVDAVAEQRYREALTRHQQNWHRAARQVGAVFTVLVAERLLEDWDLETLVAAEVLQVV